MTSPLQPFFRTFRADLASANLFSRRSTAAKLRRAQALGTATTPHGSDARRMGAWAQDLTGISTKTIAASTSTTTAGAGAALVQWHSMIRR